MSSLHVLGQFKPTDRVPVSRRTHLLQHIQHLRHCTQPHCGYTRVNRWIVLTNVTFRIYFFNNWWDLNSRHIVDRQFSSRSLHWVRYVYCFYHSNHKSDRVPQEFEPTTVGLIFSIWAVDLTITSGVQRDTLWSLHCAACELIHPTLHYSKPITHEC